MAVNKVTVLPKTQWGVTNLIPRGHTTNIFAPGGMSKTRLICWLAVQATRPQNEGTFLGYQVRHGKVLILDADDPTTHGYQLWLNRFFAAYPDADRSLIDLRAIEGGLTPRDVEAIKDELKRNPPTFIIIDTFASAFLGMDTLKGHLVQLALVGLADLAKALNACVVVLDHTGKLQKGQTVAEKGAYGSGKSFSPRAMFALSRVNPKDVEGRDVFRLDCTKMSYAKEPSPLGFEVLLEERDMRARVKVVSLPNQYSQKDKAKTVILEQLEAAKGEPVARQVILNAVVQKVNVIERYAVDVLKELLEQRHEIETHELGGKGKPKAYSTPLKGYQETSLNEENTDRDSILFDEHASSSNGVCSSNNGEGLLHEQQTPYSEKSPLDLADNNPSPTSDATHKDDYAASLFKKKAA
ncbi:MAG: AAA family ATPase [Trueperaceae bacterium]